MPLPEPNNGESQNECVERCRGDGTMNDEYPDTDQRSAVCHSQWTRSKDMGVKTTTEWLRADTEGRPVGVDRETNVIHGYVVAQQGSFKTEGRGEFDHKSLSQIVKLMRAEPEGLKVRLGHPTLSDDGLAKYIGRAKKPRLETMMSADATGEVREFELVRADLHISDLAMNEPIGGGMPLGEYIMRRAEEDPASFSSSLVLDTDQEMRLDPKGRPKLDEQGNELPPLWRPKALHASDVVDTGDAVDAFLSPEIADRLPDAVVRRG